MVAKRARGKRGYSKTTCGQRGIEGAVSMEHEAREGKGTQGREKILDLEILVDGERKCIL